MYTGSQNQTTATRATSQTGIGLDASPERAYRDESTLTPSANGTLADALGALDGHLRELEERIARLGAQLGPVLLQEPADPSKSMPSPPNSTILGCVHELSMRVTKQIDAVHDLSRRLVV